MNVLPLSELQIEARDFRFDTNLLNTVHFSFIRNFLFKNKSSNDKYLKQLSGEFTRKYCNEAIFCRELGSFLELAIYHYSLLVGLEIFRNKRNTRYSAVANTTVYKSCIRKESNTEDYRGRSYKNSNRKASQCMN